MTNIKDLISVIMPSFNSNEYIPYAINSVLNQTYEKWELLIIDNNSNDATIETVNEFIKKNNKIKLIKSNYNNGPGFARNLGIKQSKGKYLAFLDSDDFWDSKFLESLIYFLKINKYYFVYCPYFIYTNKNSKLNNVLPYACESNILKSNPLSCLAILIEKDKFNFKFDTIMKTHEDIDMWIKIINLNGIAHRYNEPLAYYRQRKHSLSSKKLRNAIDRWRFLRINMKFNLLKSLYYFLSYIFYGLNKYFF